MQTVGSGSWPAGVVDHVRSTKSPIIGQDPLGVDYLYQRMCEAVTHRGVATGGPGNEHENCVGESDRARSDDLS